MSPAQEDECVRSLERRRQRGEDVTGRDARLPVDCPSCTAPVTFPEDDYRRWRAGRKSVLMCPLCLAGFNAGAARFTRVVCTDCGEESGYLPMSMAKEYNQQPTYRCEVCRGWKEEDDDPAYYPKGNASRRNQQIGITVRAKGGRVRHRDDDDDEDDEIEDRPRRRRGRECRACGSDERPVMRRQVSTGGWIVFAVLLTFCFPLFWIGLLMQEDALVCPDCGAKRGVIS